MRLWRYKTTALELKTLSMLRQEDNYFSRNIFYQSGQQVEGL